MKLGSLFDGSGGFPLAAVLCGITPVWASEIEPYPLGVTKARLPDMRHYGDITKIHGGKIEPVDITSFGSPCQDLSVAGNRAGLEGKRSGLFMEAVRIIREMREATHGRYPTFVIWENVPGAYSSAGGEDFRIVLEEIASIAAPVVSIPRSPRWRGAGEILADGCSIAWRTLDAQYWGIPQRRKRVFLVADFGGERAGKILFEREGLHRDIAPGGKAWKEIAGYFGANAKGASRDRGANIVCAGFDLQQIKNAQNRATVEPGKPYPKRAGCAGGGKGILIQDDMAATIATNNDQAVLCAGFSAGQSRAAGSIGYKEEQAPTLRGAESGTNQTPSVICIAGNTIDREPKNGGNHLGPQEDISYTLNTADRHAVCMAVDCRNHRVAEVSGTLQAKENGGQSLNYVNPVICGYRGYGDYKISDVSKDIMASDDITTGDLVIDNPFYAVRRLTPLECCRLQGFPDWWTADVDGSDSAQYKMWGNGVALPCVLYVMEGIAEAMKNKKGKGE